MHSPAIEKNLRLVLQGDSENLLALETLGMIAMERQQWPRALEYFQRLTELQPRNALFLKTAGTCALKVGDTETALRCFESACGLVSDDSEALTFLGDCESKLGKAQEAEKDWKRALSVLGPGAVARPRVRVVLHEKLAGSMYNRAEYEECLAYAREGTLQGKSSVLRAYEGLSLLALRRSVEGLAILKEVAASADRGAAAMAEAALKERTQ